MRITCIILSLFSFIFTTTLLVPEEYSTIQAGVDAAVDGDTVLVNQGTYYENIHLTKSIVLTSYAIYDDLTEWKEYSPIFGEWQVSNYNINNTVIDGSTATDDYGSCILIYSPDDECITPTVSGFTIQNGSTLSSSGHPWSFGGGVVISGASLTVRDVIIQDNESHNNTRGHALFVENSSSLFDNVIVKNNNKGGIRLNATYTGGFSAGMSGSTGGIYIVADPSTMDNVPVGDHQYDLEIIQGNTIVRLVEGTFVCKSNITG